MTCNRAIPSVDNILKIYLSSNFYNKFTSTFYNEGSFTFGYIFREYIKHYVRKFYHPEFIKEWKLYLDISLYEKFNDGVNLPSIKKNNRHNIDKFWFPVFVMKLYCFVFNILWCMKLRIWNNLTSFYNTFWRSPPSSRSGFGMIRMIT